ncbi:MAG: hypothetical protein ACXW2P_10545, partial [Thermoanaerobaculia bacterium]
AAPRPCCSDRLRGRDSAPLRQPRAQRGAILDGAPSRAHVGAPRRTRRAKAALRPAYDKLMKQANAW